MRILIVSSRFYPQIVGSGTTAYITADELARRGHEVTVLTDSNIRSLLEQEQGTAFTTQFIDDLEDYSLGRQSMKKPASQIFEFLNTNTFDIIHVCNFMPMQLFTVMKSIITTPIVFTFFNTPSQDRGALGYFNQASLNVALATSIIKQRAYNKLIVGSNNYYETAVKLGAKKADTKISYLGIDENFLKNISDSETIVHEYIGEVAEGSKIVMLPGRVTQQKGVEEAVLAFASSRFPKNVNLLIPGMAKPFDPVLAKKLVEAAKQYDISDQIIIPKKPIRREHLAVFYKLADIVITPSYYEGLGLAAIEALCLSRPLVATNTKGLDEIVKHEWNGLLVPPKDSEALANAILRLLNNPSLVEQVCKNAAPSVKKFNHRNYVTNLERTYKELVRL